MRASVQSKEHISHTLIVNGNAQFQALPEVYACKPATDPRLWRQASESCDADSVHPGLINQEDCSQ